VTRALLYGYFIDYMWLAGVDHGAELPTQGEFW
jgi:hypothetical protein